MENKEKFATFFGEASKGRKLGAILAWIAAVALIVVLFVPAFGIGSVQTAGNSTVGSSTASSSVKETVDDLEAHDISVASYLTSYSAKLASLENDEEAGNALNIVLLVVYAVLIIAAVALALFTMNALSLVATLAAVAEVLVLYFMSYSGKVTDLLLTFSIVDKKPTLSVIVIIALAAAAVLQIVGTILTYTIHSDDEEMDFGDYDDDDDRNAETGLFGDESTSEQAAASLVQMNTGKSFAIQEGAEIIIGKGSQANIIVSNPIISRAHAKISLRGGVCTIQDLGSKNGTFVGDQKLPNGGSAVVPNGGYITLGNEIFQFNF